MSDLPPPAPAPVPEPVPASPPAREPAGFWVRGGALMVDTVALWIFGLALGKTLEALHASIVTNMVFGFIFGVVYNVGMNGTWGATLGKMAAGIVIVRPDGSPIGWGRAGLRLISTYLSILTMNLGFVMAAFTSRKRALHDFLADTEVVFADGVGVGRRRAFLALGVANPLLGVGLGVWVAWKVMTPALIAQRASRYEKDGKYALAAVEFEKLVQIAPKNWNAWNGLCWELSLSGKPEEGLAACDKALALERAPAALDSRGMALLKLKRYDESAAAYEEALRLNPRFPSSLYGLGLAKRGKGDRAGGDADLAEAARLDPMVAGNYVDYGVPPPGD